MTCWFWIMIWFFMFIPPCNNVTFCFPYINFATRAEAFVNLTWRIGVSFFQAKQLFHFFSFPNYLNIAFFISKLMELFYKDLDGFFVFYAKRNFNPYCFLWKVKKSWWYNIYIFIIFIFNSRLKLSNNTVNEILGVT